MLVLDWGRRCDEAHTRGPSLGGVDAVKGVRRPPRRWAKSGYTNWTPTVQVQLPGQRYRQDTQ